VGSRLHDAALAEARSLGYHALTLWVLEGNTRARAFYEARGWTADGKRLEITLGPGASGTEVRYRRPVP
jgi:GNAT superfamily N-acetyltransferase